jgi:lipid II:glycine glycyltransferase (peptidoglycan interpeptide bridge formation enzyme)
MNKEKWNDIITSLPNPHLLQSWEWGEVKQQFGWTAFHKEWREGEKVVAAVLVLEREVNLAGINVGLRMHYTPKGPLLADWEDPGLLKRVFNDLVAFARERGAFLLKIDPDAVLGYGEPGTEDAEEGFEGPVLVNELRQDGWRFSNEQVQFRNTVFVDLTKSEEELLASMKQKTRYNVRLAGRKGVVVRQGGQDDFEMLYQMYAETAVRDGFAIRGKEYYLAVWQTFWDSGMLVPLIAEVEEQPVAGLMLFNYGGTAYYLHGMSRAVHRNLMPTYLLQWEAMRAAKEKGCSRYDLWGAPDDFIESDSLWGVYRFKRGLGGEVVRTVGAWDLPLKPVVFALYAQVWPRIMGLLRARGRKQTQQDL